MQATFAHLQVFSVSLVRVVRQDHPSAQLQECLEAAAEALNTGVREFGQTLTNRGAGHVPSEHNEHKL